MATHLRTMDIPPDSVTPLRMLTGLYRSTFVEKMQAHFRSMLTGAYGVYAAALEEDFDPPLKAHLTDILQDIIARAPELTEIFAEELLRHFQRLTALSGMADAAPAPLDEPKQLRSPDALPEIDQDSAIQDFVAKTIRGIETRHGSLILAVTRTYVKLVDQPAEDFRPPWSPACLFAAFATVLDRIEVPIHGRVKLALYKTFTHEVLRHIGDACLAFRGVLPSDLAQLDILRDNEQASSVAMPETADVREDQDESPTDATGKIDLPRAPMNRKLAHLAAILLGSLGLIWGGWRLGAYIARTQSLPAGHWKMPAETNNTTLKNPLAETRPDQPPSPAEQTSMSPVPTGQPAPTPRASEPTLSVNPEEKREAMRAVRLKNFQWQVDVDGNGLLFKLTIANTSTQWIGGIEVVCSQYSDDMDFLEAAKAVLQDAIGPGQTREFQAIPIGFANKQTERVNCVIADLNIEPDH